MTVGQYIGVIVGGAFALGGVLAVAGLVAMALDAAARRGGL